MENEYLKINVASVKDGHASIYFKYHEEAVSILKAAVPGPARRYCRENRTWDIDILYIPDLIRSFAQYSIGGMYYECTSLVKAYGKYCEKNGIENSLENAGGPVPVQEQLPADQNTSKKKA